MTGANDVPELLVSSAFSAKARGETAKCLKGQEKFEMQLDYSPYVSAKFVTE